MATLVDLSKKVQVTLEKRNAPVIKLRVGFAADVSGSAKGLYDSGLMQEITNRLQAMAIKFDDDGQLDMWAFDDKCIPLPAAISKDFNTYVHNNIMDLPNIWNGTLFTPVLDAMKAFYFGRTGVKGLFSMFTKSAAPSTDPVYLVLETDGENNDEELAEALISSLAEKPVYLQLIGVGMANFKFLRRMSNRYDHVGFMDMSNPGKVSDEQMFDSLISEELLAWYKRVTQK